LDLDYREGRGGRDREREREREMVVRRSYKEVSSVPNAVGTVKD